MKALTELKNQVAVLSIEMTEMVLSSELSNPDKHKELINQVLKERL